MLKKLSIDYRDEIEDVLTKFAFLLDEISSEDRIESNQKLISINENINNMKQTTSLLRSQLDTYNSLN